MKIGIFGGTFNPPHIGHLIGAESALEQLSLARVIFMPASIPPHKEEPGIPKGEQRLQMVIRSIHNNPRLQASDLEVRRGGLSYTIDTLKELAAQFSGDSLFLLIGMDMLADFGSWKSTEDILELAELAVLTRPEFSLPSKLPQKIKKRLHICKMPDIGISSSEIRRRIHEGKSIRYVVPEQVVEFIRKYRLYVE